MSSVTHGEQRRSRTSKRGNREGSIYQRADGKWCAAITLDSGKRKVLYGRTRQEVASKLASALRDAQQGLPIPALRLSTARYLEDWLEHTVRASRRAATYRTYGACLRRHVIPSIGSVPLAKLSPQHVSKLQRELAAKGLSPASVAVVRAALCAALTQATKWGLVGRNVVVLVDPPSEPEHEAQVLSPEQASAFLASAQGDPFENLFRVMLATGLRIGEALGLRWSDIDPEQRVLRVRQQLVTTPRQPKTFSEPKSASGRRVIPLIPAAAEALRAERARLLQNRLRAAGAWQSDLDLVFVGDRGQPLVPTSVRRHFHRIADAAGLPTTTSPHTLRHSAATYLLAAGVPDRVVMDILGHSTLSMTSRYQHVLDSMLQDAASKLARIFPSAAV